MATEALWFVNNNSLLSVVVLGDSWRRMGLSNCVPCGGCITIGPYLSVLSAILGAVVFVSVFFLCLFVILVHSALGGGERFPRFSCVMVY